jgi:hypothetical protein
MITLDQVAVQVAYHHVVRRQLVIEDPDSLNLRRRWSTHQDANVPGPEIELIPYAALVNRSVIGRGRGSQLEVHRVAASSDGVRQRFCVSMGVLGLPPWLLKLPAWEDIQGNLAEEQARLRTWGRIRRTPTS